MESKVKEGNQEIQQPLQHNQPVQRKDAHTGIMGQSLAGQKPAYQSPAGQKPAYQSPAGQKPVYQSPAGRKPPIQAAQSRFIEAKQRPIQRKANNTGLPDNLKSGIENLSGYSMDDVKVHYNSDKPVQLQAHAYAQGTDIHVASGQEQHLAHEAWHVVQQKQGRVQATTQLKSKQAHSPRFVGVNLNDDAGLEREADIMGAKALQTGEATKSGDSLQMKSIGNNAPVQRAVDLRGFEESQNGRYFINSAPDHRKVLYARRDAPAPMPDGLYRKETEVSEGAKPIELYTYIPNARLYSKGEKQIVNEEETKWYSKTALKTETVEDIMRDVKNRDMTPETVTTPEMGMLGDNDCKGFADSLRGVISGQGRDNRHMEGKELGVGDQMTHNWNTKALEDAELGCNYHSSTVVATDGESLVTLEAHAGQDITAPDFHMRNGVDGFIRDNLRAVEEGEGKYVDLGEDYRIDRANGDAEAFDTAQEQGRRMHRNPMLAGGAPSQPTSVVLKTSTVRTEVIRSLKQITNKSWRKVMPGVNFSSVPDGIARIQEIMRRRIASAEDAAEMLEQVKAEARRWIGNEEVETIRSFYVTLAGMRPDDERNMFDITQEIIFMNVMLDN